MILFDYSPLIIDGAAYSLHKIRKIELKLVRFHVLKKIHETMDNFSHIYGIPVICREGKGYWRKDIFPQYKANRKKARSKDSMDWGEIYRVGDIIANELETYFKYPVISIPNYEADDVIAAVVRDCADKHLIVSRDKDFLQLRIFGNVKQWDLVSKKFVEIPDEDTQDEFFVKMIIKGQQKDGVPNFLSHDNAMLEEGRQKSITKGMVEVIVSNCIDLKGEIDFEKVYYEIENSKVFQNVRKTVNTDKDVIKKQFERNNTVLNLRTPNYEIEEKVMRIIEENKYDSDFQTLFNYFANNGLSEMSGDMQKFMV